MNKKGIHNIWMKSSTVYSECNLGPSQIHKRILPQPLPGSYLGQLRTSQALQADHMPCQRCWGGCCTDHLWLGLWRGKCRIWDQSTTNGKQWTAWNLVEFAQLAINSITAVGIPAGIDSKCVWMWIFWPNSFQLIAIQLQYSVRAPIFRSRPR